MKVQRSLQKKQTDIESHEVMHMFAQQKDHGSLATSTRTWNNNYYGVAV